MGSDRSPAVFDQAGFRDSRLLVRSYRLRRFQFPPGPYREAVSSAVFALVNRDPDRFSSLIQTKRSVGLLPLHQHAQGETPQCWR
jgi:hypothetical protein